MNLLLMILGMAVVTYLPRLIPALFLDRFEFPDWFERWLKSIPLGRPGLSPRAEPYPFFYLNLKPQVIGDATHRLKAQLGKRVKRDSDFFTFPDMFPVNVSRKFFLLHALGN